MTGDLVEIGLPHDMAPHTREIMDWVAETIIEKMQPLLGVKKSRIAAFRVVAIVNIGGDDYQATIIGGTAREARSIKEPLEEMICDAEMANMAAKDGGQ